MSPCGISFPNVSKKKLFVKAVDDLTWNNTWLICVKWVYILLVYESACVLSIALFQNGINLNC